VNEFHPQLHSEKMRESQKLAFEKILNNGLLSRRRFQAYKCIYDNQHWDRIGVTSGELDRYGSESIQGWSRSFSPRLVELVRLGVVEELPYLVKCSITGQSVTGYITTTRSPDSSKLKNSVVKKPHKKTIAQAVLEIRSCYEYWIKCGGGKLAALEQILAWLGPQSG